ncbi:MAG: hypothetical protein ACO3B6_00275, partial [Ilumatobacteraceae bacterium]
RMRPPQPRRPHSRRHQVVAAEMTVEVAAVAAVEMTVEVAAVAAVEMTVAATMSPHPQRPCRGRRVHLLRPRPCPQRYPSPHQLQQHSDDW